MAEIFYYILQVFQVLLIIGMGFYLYYDWKLGVAAVPSSRAAARQVASLLRDLSGDTVVDIGSGWGGMAFAAARACPDKTIIGIEYAWLPYAWARLRQKLFSPFKNLQFLYADLFTYDLSQTQIVFCYMPPEMMVRLEPKLAELPVGALIISNSAAATGMQPEKTISVPGWLPETIYLYRRV